MMRRWFFALGVLSLVAARGMAEETAAAPGVPPCPAAPGGASFCLWQLPAQTPSQMMSYVIRTIHGKVIVIDGGTAGDAAYLAGFLRPLGNNVEAWIVTHPHSDHVNALREILKNPQGVAIQAIYGALPSLEWIMQHGNEDEVITMRLFSAALTASGRAVTPVSPGQVLEIDGVTLLFLAVNNPEITRNAVNNSSLVFRVSDAAKSVLFLADLGGEGGEKLLQGPFAGQLAADYVQMAHHGQNGVGEDVYQKIKPAYCLWPTPLWLWENDKGGGKGSGPWRTLEVRAWMDKLPIKAHYVMYEGLHKIE